MNKFYENGLCFSCNNCSQCCRFEGGAVILSQEDLDSLSKWADVTKEQFILMYCRYLTDRKGTSYLCLREKSNNDCIFWSADANDGKGGCEAYNARPAQCRTYPFWTKILESEEAWESEKKTCPAIGTGHKIKKEEIEQQLAIYEGRCPITK